MIWAWLMGCTPPGPAEVFADEVVPVLEQSCGSTICHGVAVDADDEVVDWSKFFFEVDDGHIVDVAQARAASRRAINTREDPAFSSMIRKPLPYAFGGTPHIGGDNFRDPDDPGVRALERWIELERSGGEDPQPLDALEQQFADTVQPALVSATCTNGHCHGAAGVGLRFDPGMAGRFSIEASRHNHDVARSMISLDGDGLQSRLLRKGLPLHGGGIVHKGGNDAFFTGPGDPRVQTILRWVCAERRAATGGGCGPELTGFVFVRGPLGPRGLFDLDVFEPGTDLWLARTGTGLGVREVSPLQLHDGTGDARDPAVDPTGRKVLFALRTERRTGHAIHLLDLDSGKVRPLTSPRAGHTDRDPAWGPDGTVWFASTRTGLLSDSGLRDAELYTVHLDTGRVRRRTWTPQIERMPVFFELGEEAGGEIGFTALREAEPAQRRAHIFRFPPGLSTEYHQHFGITPPEDLHADMRELPDGRYIEVLGDLRGVWGAGQLAVIDRNFGPELAAGTEPSLPFYAEPLIGLDDAAAAHGDTAALYRDPAPLPSGQVLAAVASGALRTDDPATVPDFAIRLLTLDEAPDGRGPSLTSSRVLVDATGLSDYDPEPIVLSAAPEARGAMAWNPQASTGQLVHQGYPMISAILDNLSPSGLKRPFDRVRAVRLVEPVPMTAADRVPVPASETRHQITGATSTGLSRYAPARVLAEVPLAADGTLQVELPAGTAIRLQGLDRHGMSAGAAHNRWFGINPGQTVPQGVQPDHYDQLCGMCHGAANGDPGDAFPVPDVLSGASLTLARYRNQDPRRPLAPVSIDPKQAQTVDFIDDIEPILAPCARCHGTAAGLSLTDTPTPWYTDAYESLLAPGGPVQPGSARASRLFEVLDQPDHRIADEDRATLIRWVDLGAPFVGAP